MERPMSEHTPTPWTYRAASDVGDGIIIGGENSNAALVPGYNDHPHNIANAAFIIRAVNNHAALVNVLFRTYPELLCFSLGGRADLPPGVDIGDSEAQIFITDVDFGKPVSQDYQNEIGEALGGIVSDIVTERPEALEVLPGRTFARTLQ